MACKSKEALEKRAEYQREYRRKWREENKDYDHSAHYSKHGRKGHLRRKYGMTEAVFSTLSLVSDDGCYICGSKEKLAVDHSHENNQVRGLLCRKCNLMLGLARDNPAILLKAFAYLKKREEGPLMVSWRTAQERFKLNG